MSSESSSMCTGETPVSSGHDPDDPGYLDSGGSIANVVRQPSPPPSILFCTRCKKSFKTKKGFIKHRALHIQKDYLKEASSTDVKENCQDIARNVLKSMLDSDPNSDIRRELISFLLLQTSHDAWLNFVDMVSDYISETVFQKTNVLPQMQHERNLSDLSEWLGNKNERAQLFESLLLVLQNKKFSKEQVQPVIFRFCFKMYEQLELDYLRKASQREGRSSSSAGVLPLSSEEQQTLFYASGSVVRFFLARGKKQKNVKVSAAIKARRKCIEERLLFVEGQNYSSDYFQLKSWFDKLDRGGLVAINENFFHFLLDVEYIIRRIFVGQDLKYEWVMNEMYKPEFNILIEYWCAVTNAYMSESESLLFLESVVKRFIQFSCKAEAGLRRRTLEETMQTVALRTGLKRN